jgi:hypothetical protein
LASIKEAVLRNFDSDSYTATVEIAGSGKAYLQGVKVARNIPAGEMVVGRNVLVIFIDEHSAKDAVVTAVY